jgi:hypothetical protein
VNLYYNLTVTLGIDCVGSVGAFEAGPLGSVEATVKYHPVDFWCLTAFPHREPGHCLVGSLTGAVASQNVTEARDGSLSPIGNRAASAMA